MQGTDMNNKAQSEASEELSSSRKRKRKTYSCFDCRRRKLKCDREYPCGRCVKEGHSESCAFRDDGHNSEIEEQDGPPRSLSLLDSTDLRKNTFSPTAKSNGSSPFNPDQSVLLHRKIALLESRLAKFETPDSAQVHEDQASSTQRDKEPTFFKGRSFKTQYYGPTNPGSLFGTFPEVFATTGEGKFKSASLTKVQKELAAIRVRRKERKKARPAETVSDLSSLLPSRDTMDHKVQLYIETYETTLRIVHKPSFWAEYNAKPLHQWKESFTAVVLMIVATVNCMAVSELSFKEDMSSARVETQRLVTTVEEWANRQSQKYLTVETFQVQLLLLLAKKTTALQRKRAWSSSGFLLRLAITAGLHRDPSDLHGTISVFDQEMRRRLWTTIVEWDLAACINRGLPCITTSIPTNCRPPANINDADIHKDFQVAPEGRSLSERTDTSFLRTSLQSLPLRASLTSLLNDPDTRLSWSEVLSYEEKIQQELQNLPEWTRRHNTMDAVMLDLQIRQNMLWLYSSHSRGQAGPRTAYARLAIVNSASEMIEQYSRLGAADVNALNMLRNDMYQCIVAISLSILSEARSASMTRNLVNTLQPVCEKAFLFLEDKVLKVGEGYNHMWYASAAFATAQTSLDPKLSDARTIAGDRVAKIYYKVLTYQEPGDTLIHNDDAVTSSSWQVTADTANAQAPVGFPNQQPPQELDNTLDFADFQGLTAGWMNDDFFGYDTSFL